MDVHSRAIITTRAGADFLALTFMFIFVIEAMTLSMMPVVTNGLRAVVGLTDAQIGLLSSVFLGFYGAVGIPAGIAAARWGGRMLAISCGGFVVGSLVFALSSGFGGFLVGRAIQGIGGGMVIATCGPVMAHCLPPARLGRAWGILGMGWGIGSMAALLVLPSIEKLGGYRAVFLAVAGLAFVVGVMALSQRVVRTRPHHADGATSGRALVGGLLAAVTNREVLLLALANMATVAISVGITAWTPSFLQDLRNAREDVSVYLVAGFGAAALAANALGAVASQRWGKYRVIVGSLAVVTVITALVPLLPGVPLVFVMVLLTGVFATLFFPAMMGYLPQVVAKPEQVGAATGINTAMGFSGSLVAPWIFGLLLDAGGRSSTAYLSGYFMLAIFALLPAIGMLFFRRENGRTRCVSSNC